MRNLLSGEYVPFGSQYYRAPSPAPGEWETDLAALSRLGFNTVKFWVQWRWNVPAEGKYDFADIDRLMDLAERYRLRVMLNTIVDVAPVWVYRTYPDASMITLDGRRIGPQVQPHRQIGGLGLCLNHARAVEAMMEFIRTTVRRYREHPALEMWNVASEPELTSSMAEMRLYADDAGRMGDMLCYCPRCLAAFRGWLATKYGTVARLNTAWNRNYSGFDDVEVPLTRNSFGDMIDWRMFFVATLGDNVRRRFEVAREEDHGKHPLLCHPVFIQGFPVTSTANDPWNVGQYGDLHGITQMDDPMMCDVARSCAKGRPAISAEMLMLYGYTLDLPKPITLNDIKRYVFNGIAANLKGFIFWQYRAETLAREAPAWGLTRLDGSETPWLRGFAEVNRVLQKNARFLLEASPRPAEVAVLYSPENQIFAWAATGTEKTATDSLLGVHAALYRANYPIDFIHPRELPTGILQRYKVVVVPVPYVISEEICALLEQWVRGGGVLIGEAYFAGWDGRGGRHHTTVPGFGLHRVFQARQDVVVPPDADGSVPLEVTAGLPSVPSGTRLAGCFVRESFTLEGATALAVHADGSPAVTYASYGKGHAFLVGTYLGLAVHRGRDDAGFLAGLVGWKADIRVPQVEGTAHVRVDVLTHPDGAAMVIARNLAETQARVTVDLPDVSERWLIEQFSGDMVAATGRDGGARIVLELGPGEVLVYHG